MAFTPINFGQLANTPNASTATPTPLPQTQGLGSKILTGAENIGKDAFNTLIGTPAVRFGQVVGNAIAPALGINSQQAQYANDQPVNLPLGLGTVAPQKGGVAGAEQIGGQTLKSASYLVPGAMEEGIASKGIIPGILQGTKLGTIAGTFGSAGTAMEQGGSASDVVNAGISGAKTGALTGAVTGGVTGTIGNIWDWKNGGSSYDTNLAKAQSAQTQAGIDTNQAANQASGAIYSAKGDAATQFSEAPKIIEQTQPGLGFELKASTAEKLNALKDTKAFSLPDYLRPTSENYGNGNIDITKLGGADASGIKLSPTQTQDLVTRLNDLQFNSKGDVVVNQQTQNLINEIKGQAQDTFGHVTDAQGNSVWNQAYQKYATTMDAVHAMNDIVNTNKTSGGMSNPLDKVQAIDNILKLQNTSHGQAALAETVQEFKNRTGYDLTDPISTINKMADSNKEFAKALQGNWSHQFMEGLKNPRAISRRTLYIAGTVIGLTGIATLLHKQIGGLFTGGSQ